MQIVIEDKLKLEIRRSILEWYRKNARDLPWRKTRDPYAVWVSEIMLQQTRVEAVIPYYQRWMEAFPTVQALAGADQDQVLRLWEGLGYYSRVLNLVKAARIVDSSFRGEIPYDLEDLESLPGIGRYTAGAIRSIAYNLPAPIVEGNIRRVFARLFQIESPIRTSETEKVMWQIAEEILSEENPGEFNQALMELGALVCIPGVPRCAECPLRESCQAFKSGLQDYLPNRKEKKPVPHYQVTAAVITRQDKVLITKRPQQGLLGGMWEFPGGKQEAEESLPETLIREIREELEADISVLKPIGSYDHAYSHYRVTLHAFQCRLISENLKLNYHTDLAWVDPGNLPEYPMGKLDRLIANQLLDPLSE